MWPAHRGTTACSWHLAGSVSAPVPGSRVKATVTSSERHPASLVLGSRTLTPLIVQRPTSRGDLETAVQIHTHQKHTTHIHTHTPHAVHTPHAAPENLTCSEQLVSYLRGPDEGFGQLPRSWAGLGTPEGGRAPSLLHKGPVCAPCASGLPPASQHTSPPTCRLSGLLDRRALGPHSPLHWKSLSHVGSPPLRCSGCPPLQDLAQGAPQPLCHLLPRPRCHGSPV